MKAHPSIVMLDDNGNEVGTVLASDQQGFYLKSKLLSAHGCDITTQVEDERVTSKSLTPNEVAFYKSLPEWNEEHYDFDYSGSLRSQEHSEGAN